SLRGGGFRFICNLGPGPGKLHFAATLRRSQEPAFKPAQVLRGQLATHIGVDQVSLNCFNYAHVFWVREGAVFHLNLSFFGQLAQKITDNYGLFERSVLHGLIGSFISYWRNSGNITPRPARHKPPCRASIARGYAWPACAGY